MAGVYVDNVTVLGFGAKNVDAISGVVQAHADEADIPMVWTHENAVQHLESVGAELDLEHLVAYNKPRRVWRFDLASRALVRRGRVRGEHVQIWAGHATSLHSLGRPGFTILDGVYKFIRTAW